MGALLESTQKGLLNEPHFQCGGGNYVGRCPTAVFISTLVVWGDDVGPAPHPSLNHFFLGKRNGLEIQRKSLGLAVAA